MRTIKGIFQRSGYATLEWAIIFPILVSLVLGMVGVWSVVSLQADVSSVVDREISALADATLSVNPENLELAFSVEELDRQLNTLVNGIVRGLHRVSSQFEVSALYVPLYFDPASGRQELRFLEGSSLSRGGLPVRNLERLDRIVRRFLERANRDDGPSLFAISRLSGYQNVSVVFSVRATVSRGTSPIDSLMTAMGGNPHLSVSRISVSRGEVDL